MPRQDSHRLVSGLLAWIAAMCGCALAPALRPEGRQPEKVLVTAETHQVPQAETPRIFTDRPGAIYRNPRIGIVYLRAHQDAEGRLLGPQVMYQVVDPGGWDIKALESGNGYLPAINVQAPSVPEDEPLLDPDAARAITITGLMSPEDRPEAEAMARRAGGALSAVYDKQAGWLLIPTRKP